MTHKELHALGRSESEIHTWPWPLVGNAYAIDGDRRQPRPVTHRVRHGLDSFAYGYEGSGPAERARCLLIDWFGAHEQADNRDAHPLPVSSQQFKREFIARVPQTVREFEIDANAIDAWMRTQAARDADF